MVSASDFRPQGPDLNPAASRIQLMTIAFHCTGPFIIIQCALVLVNHLEDCTCPEKVWLGKLTMLDMTLMR